MVVPLLIHVSVRCVACSSGICSLVWGCGWRTVCQKSHAICPAVTASSRASMFSRQRSTALLIDSLLM